MKKNIVIIVGIIIIILAVIIWKYSIAPGQNLIKSFAVEGSDFVATTKNASRVEVLAVPEGGTKGEGDITLGTMELVEKNEAGDQTWVMPTPPEKRAVIEVFARAYDDKNKEAGSISLPEKGVEDITAVVWPPPSEDVVYGMVRELTGNILRLTNGAARDMDMVVTLSQTTKFVDQAGRPITRSRLTKNTKVVVTGMFTDELAITATQIELR